MFHTNLRCITSELAWGVSARPLGPALAEVEDTAQSKQDGDDANSEGKQQEAISTLMQVVFRQRRSSKCFHDILFENCPPHKLIFDDLAFLNLYYTKHSSEDLSVYVVSINIIVYMQS